MPVVRSAIDRRAAPACAPPPPPCPPPCSARNAPTGANANAAASAHNISVLLRPRIQPPSAKSRRVLRVLRVLGVPQVPEMHVRPLPDDRIDRALRPCRMG